MVLPGVVCPELCSWSVDLALWAESVCPVSCAWLCVPRILVLPRVRGVCVWHILQPCELSVVFPDIGPGLGCLPGVVWCVCLLLEVLCVAPGSVGPLLCAWCFVPYLGSWQLCLVLYSERVPGFCAPSVCA